MKKYDHDLAIIIVNYNTKELLDDCLNSVFKADRPRQGIEVIVVDNGSHDNSPGMVKEKYPEVKLIQSKKNLGFAKGNNLGVASCNSKTILFLNSDTYKSRARFSARDTRPAPSYAGAGRADISGLPALRALLLK